MSKETRPFVERMENALSKLVFIYMGIVLVAFLAVPFLAYTYYVTPFPGAFFEQTLLVNNIKPPDGTQRWELYRQGIEFGDQLIAVNDQPVQNAAEVRQILLGYFPGETHRFTFRTQDGDIREISVVLSQFQLSDLVWYLAIPGFVALVFVSVALWIYSLRRNETSGRAFAMLGLSVSVVMGTLFDLYTTHFLSGLWSISVPLVGASIIHLGLVFPQEARIVGRYPFLRWISYVVALALGVFSIATLRSMESPYAYISAWQYSYLFTAIGMLTYLGIMFYRLSPGTSPVVRQQARTVLIGSVFAFVPVIIYLLLAAFVVTEFSMLIFLPIIIFPIATGYAVLRYRLVRTDYIMGRAFLYSALSLLAVIGYLSLAFGASLVFGSVFNNPLVIGLTVLLIALLLNPIRMRLQETIDSIFFRGERAYQEKIKEYTRALTSTVDLQQVVKILRDQITVSLLPSHLHIYIYQLSSDQYIPAPDETGRPSSDVNFSANSPLVEVLRQETLPMFFEPGTSNPKIQSERARLLLIGAHLIVPMPGRERLIGWIAIGERLSGEAYTTIDINFLEALASQGSVALERAQALSSMERRVHEMNILSRISQGINVTLDFDNILELIYAQTSQIIPVSDLNLVLYNQSTQNTYYAFYLEDDERVPERENIPLSPKSTIGQDVITSRRAIVTQDFMSQCQILGVTPQSNGLYAWMGVPLNTGAETLGALCIASRNPDVVYTRAQMELLQAIADQAAGAIVKSRLIQETERRAQQLSTLNIITRQLTSTLELQPLLNNILESAVNILNSEAGSLFLVDGQTDELIFQVTVGPVASNLVGQRLPPGTGFVGESVDTRQPIIVNDVQSTQTWNSETDKQTGFVTKAILIVPMEVKDRIIGVIEIINKRDGLPFREDDQNLLSAFAGQAAVAIENARLYTLTDQELTARVEELSVMQRIDRELNASLELDRAMRITLDWAMRQSKAESGFIGFVRENGIEIMAHNGYQAEMDQYTESIIPLDHPALQEAISSAQPRRIVMEDSSRMGTFLTGARSQLVIPIRREVRVIGLFLLESSSAERFQQDELDFLSRLADHAAIAIANAQLYAQIDAANKAKSQFVSFVAHELKNPMASIKGYTELVTGGMAGPITDMQSKFLSTVRSNVDRMNTIVSDLSDLNKIEAGMLKIEFKPTSIPEVVEEAVRSTRRQIEEKEQVIDINVPNSLPDVWADRNRMIQIAVNLVSNATKYTPNRGHIAVGAERSSQLSEIGEETPVVHLWVKDTGIGISPEDQVKIFQQYFRTETSKSQATGTGLGLNITKNLVEMQGGKIWFESEVDHGTTFHVTMPLAEN
jgi:signal transduction histidine kinase